MTKNVITFSHVTKIYKLYKNDKHRFLGIFSKKIKYKENKAVKKEKVLLYLVEMELENLL